MKKRRVRVILSMLLVILAVLFWACVYCMSVATNDPFLYFSF